MTKKQFINEILDRTCLPHQYRNKIKRDFTQEFDSKLSQGYSEDEVIKSMGDADVIASEIYESYMNNEEISRPFIEYKSKKTIFGMPLVHIVKAKRKSYIRGIGDDRNRYMKMPVAKGFIAIGRRAKGIIAIGSFSCGIISIGVLSIGLISITNIGIGLLTFGNIAFGILMALGNLAAGIFAVGNAALAYAALGNGAFGNYAIGNVANGINHINLTIQENIVMDQKTIDFISNTPAIVQSFFNNSIRLIQNSIESLDLLTTLLVIIAIVAVVSGIIISNKLEAKTSR